MAMVAVKEENALVACSNTALCFNDAEEIRRRSDTF